MKTRAVVEHIARWLSDYLEGAACRGFVVGISGGVDSAVTSALAARTGKPVRLVEMPIHQSPAQVSRARKHAEWLSARHDNLRSVEIELTGAFDALAETLPDDDGAVRERALANTRARLRMTTLYYLACIGNDLVVGTGNKVEDFGVGFFTKYGDGGVDVSPIADLTKTEVYGLARELGILGEILEAAPTDGLFGDNRTDEQQLGATYAELEAAMAFTGDETTLTPREREVLSIYRRLHRANRHKMEPIPVCQIPDELR